MPFRQSGSGRIERSRRTRFAAVAVALVVLLGFAAAAQATHLFSDVAGHTTLERVITGADPANGYATLDSQPVSASHVVRDGAGEANPAIPDAQAGRARPAPLAVLLRPADRLPARRRGVAGPGRVHRAGAIGLRGLGLAPPGGAAAVHHRLVDPPDEPVRRRQPGAAGRRRPRGDGLRADHRRPGRQHAAQRDPLDARAARGRTSLDPNSGSQNPADWDPLAHPSCAAYPPTPAQPRRGRQVHGRAGLRRLRRGPEPLLLRPDHAAGGRGRTGPRTPA